MKTIEPITIIVVITVTGLFLYYISISNRETFYQAPLFNQAPSFEQGDPVLRNVYRRWHNLEAMDRNEIARNHEFAGARHNTSRKKFIQDHIYREISKLQSVARNDIAKKRVPWRAKNPSPIGDDFGQCHFGDCQLQMDWSERILGIPSSPGNIHSYHYNV